MKPVKQTKAGTEGNCFNACVASILEWSLEEVDFHIKELGWFEQWIKFLKPKGYCLIYEAFDIAKIPATSEPVYAIAVGQNNQKTLNHAIVVLLETDYAACESKMEIVHDPMRS